MQESFLVLVDRFDLRASLSRLESAATVPTMKRQARSESLLMSFYRCSLPPATTLRPGDIVIPDKPSTALLHDYNRWLLTRFVPVAVRGDGNCLFRALSVALYGSEEHYMLLRLLCVIEALSCQEFYDISNCNFYAPFKVDVNGDLMLAGYDQFVKEMARDCSYSDMLAVLAASSVLKLPVQTYWPVTVSPGQQSPFTKLVMGRDVVSSKHPLQIMWTTSHYTGIGNPVHINHFVPLLEFSENKPSDSILIESDDDQSHAESFDVGLHETDSNVDVTVNRPISPEQSVVESKSETETVGSCFRLTTGFLSVKQLLDVIRTCDPKQVLPQVPCGPKSNCYYLVDNTNNIQREREHKNRIFWDDCGAYVRHSTAYQYYLRQSMKEIRFVDGQYCMRKKVGGVFVTEPMEPQPCGDDVLVIGRYYAHLERDEKFRKRCTWLRDGPPVLLIEYLGEFPQEVAPHGSSSKGTGEYVRSHPDVITEIKQKCTLTKSKPKGIYKEMVLSGTSEYKKPRNLKQVQNASVREACNNSSSSKNFADEIQSLSTMVTNNHPFVKTVIIDEGSTPSIILFTDEQIRDIRRFCGGSVDGSLRSVLSVDRTFNLSSLFVTVTVFKNNSVIRSTSMQPPIFIGPVMLHGDGKYKTYLMFFARLLAALASPVSSTEVRLDDQILTGSDEETALVKAIRTMFPSSKHLFCMIHCKDNVRHHLTSIGVPTDKREHILKLLFGSGGIVCSTDENVLAARIAALIQYLRQENVDAVNYMQSRILPKISENVRIVWENAWLGKHSWTNNNCESVNNLLKLDLNWKPARLTDLVSHIYDLVRLQYEDVRRAMFGQGDFQLAPQFARHYVPLSQWTSLSAEKQCCLFDNFISDNGKRNVSARTVTSSDGCLTVQGGNKIARKPGQRRRPKAERAGPKPM